MGFGIGFEGDIRVPFLCWFHSWRGIGRLAFGKRRITSILIPRHVQILCLSGRPHCRSLSSKLFETDSELAPIEAGACDATDLSLLPSQGIRRSLWVTHFSLLRSYVGWVRLRCRIRSMEWAGRVRLERSI
jgi:hypothetical protein